MIEWADKHWFLTFLLTLASIATAGSLVNRLLRTVKVCARGWPPAHLDADGDWRPQEGQEAGEATPPVNVANLHVSTASGADAGAIAEQVMERVRRSNPPRRRMTRTPLTVSEAGQMGGALLRRFVRRSL